MCQCNSLEGVAGLALVQATNAKVAIYPLYGGVLIVLMVTAYAKQRGTISSEGSCRFDEHQCWLLGLSARMGSNRTCAREAGQIALDCVSRRALDVPRTTPYSSDRYRARFSSGV